jgi:hypothetical protein
MAVDGRDAWEKLYLATGILAAGHAPLRERLARAVVPHLTTLEPHRDFPWPELRRRFEGVMSEFTALEGQLDAALRKRSDIDLTKIVHEITDIYDSVARKVGDW